MQPNQKFTDEQIIELHKRTPFLSETQLAKALKVNESTIRSRLKKLKLKPHKVPAIQPNKKFTDQQLTELYKKEPPLSTRQIAKILNVNHSTIKERLKRLKLLTKIPCTHSNILRPIIIYKCENIKPNRKFSDQQFIELYNRNLNDNQIAEILKVSRGTTFNRRIKLRLPTINPKYFSNSEKSYKTMLATNKINREIWEEKHPNELKLSRAKRERIFNKKHPLYQRKYYFKE